MTDYKTLQKAINIAFDKHKGQKRLDDSDYIQHPLRVMTSLSDEGYLTQVVAILHDVLEDCPDYTSIQMTEDFGTKITGLIMHLTHSKNETYEDYIQRIKNCGHEEVIKVKKADLLDNYWTLGCIQDKVKQKQLRDRYLKALNELIPSLPPS